MNDALILWYALFPTITGSRGPCVVTVGPDGTLGVVRRYYAVEVRRGGVVMHRYDSRQKVGAK